MRQEELDVFVWELAELVAEDKVYADVVCISTTGGGTKFLSKLTSLERGAAVATVATGPRSRSLREVGDGEKGVLVEDVALEESLQQVPRHWTGRQASDEGTFGAFEFPSLNTWDRPRSGMARIRQRPVDWKLFAKVFGPGLSNSAKASRGSQLPQVADNQSDASGTLWGEKRSVHRPNHAPSLFHVAWLLLNFF